MPAYNVERFIDESIKSILIQTYQQFELIIVDDGSTDRTLDAIRAFNDPRIKLIIHKTNQGIVVARNSALKASTGNYIAMLDADDIAFSNRLEIQIQYLNEINIDLVCSKYLNENVEPKLVQTLSSDQINSLSEAYNRKVYKEIKITNN